MLLTTRFFGVANFTIQYHYHFYPDVDCHSQLLIEIILFPQFCIKIPEQNFDMVIRKMIENLI